MTSDVRIGGVTVRFNPDGTLFIYQPDSHRLISAELAEQLIGFLAEGAGLPYPLGGTETVKPVEGLTAPTEYSLAAPVKRAPGRPRKATS